MLAAPLSLDIHVPTHSGGAVISSLRERDVLHREAVEDQRLHCLQLLAVDVPQQIAVMHGDQGVLIAAPDDEGAAFLKAGEVGQD